MREGYAVSVRMTQAQVDAGEADNLVGVRIEVVDANSQPTGTVYESGASGQSPTQVGGGSSGASRKIQLTAVGANAVTHATHAGAEVHAESGVTSVTMAAAGFQSSSAFVFGSFWLFNYTGITLPVTISGFNGGISEDATPANDIGGTGTLMSIPHTMKALIVYDEDGWVRASILGSDVTQAELDAHTSRTDNPHSVTKAQVGLGNVTNDAQLKIASNLSDLNNAATARTNLGLGDAATKNVGTIAGTVAAGNDTRLSDARTPTAHTHAQSDVTNLATDLAAKEATNNKVTTISAASTDTQYPSAKLAYDQLLLKEATANKGAASGYAGLGADGRVPFAQLPTSVGIGFRLWTPADMGTTRAIDLDFEAGALGALASITNQGSLGGTATAAAGEEPAIDSVDATGRRGALFDGVNDSLRSSAIWSLGTTYGMFAVYRRSATGAGMLISTEYPTNVAYTLGQAQDAVNNSSGGNMVFVGHFNGAWRSHAVNSVTAGNLGIVVGNFDGSNLNARLFGTDNLVAQTSLSATPSGNTRIGRRWDTAGNNYFAGRIFRIVCKAGAFTTGEMQLLEGWAAHRWNTAASLPAAHPYRNSPPIVAL